MMIPLLDARIREIAPDFRAISVVVETASTTTLSLDPQLVADVCSFVTAGGPSWSSPHLERWREVYESFGMMTHCSPAGVLRSQVLGSGHFGAENALDVLSRAVSLRYALPVSLEDLDGYVGTPFLTFALGSEPFDTTIDGSPVVEMPIEGEVIWRDSRGATSRSWNCRRCNRTRVGANTTRIWLLLERMSPMTQTDLDAASEMLIQGLYKLLPSARIEATTLRA